MGAAELPLFRACAEPRLNGVCLDVGYSRQEMFRIDHRINERFNLWGRVTIDDIPTVESGGLFGQSSVPNMAIPNRNDAANVCASIPAGGAMLPTW